MKNTTHAVLAGAIVALAGITAPLFAGDGQGHQDQSVTQLQERHSGSQVRYGTELIGAMIRDFMRRQSAVTLID